MKLDKYGNAQDSLAAQPSSFVKNFDSSLNNESNPYLDRTAIAKGSVVISSGGALILKDSSGNTILTFTPSTGAINTTGTLTAQNISAGTVTSTGAISSTGTITVNDKNMLFTNTTNGNAALRMQNSGGTERISLGIDATGMGMGTLDALYFKSNTGNKFVELAGPTAQLADTGGTNAFRVVDSQSTEAWAFRSNGQARQAKPAFFELLGTIAAPGGGGAHTARMYITTAGGKDVLAIQFNSGTVGVGTAP